MLVKNLEKTRSLSKIESAILNQLGEPMHPDFMKIYRAFMKRYCGSASDQCDVGKSYYYGWLKKQGLDDTKPYGKQNVEKFSWLKTSKIRFLKQDKTAKYYMVEAIFPLSSMNDNIYTEDELMRGARTLKGKTVNLNHEFDKELPLVHILRSEYEDEAVECLLKVDNDAGKKLGFNIQMMLDDEDDENHIFQVSVEAYCLGGSTKLPGGWSCDGLEFSGLGLLTKGVLPGVPLTRIWPLEKIMAKAESVVAKENFTVTGVKKMKEEKVKEGAVTSRSRARKMAKLELKVSEQKRELRTLKEENTVLLTKVEVKDNDINDLQNSLGESDRKLEVIVGKVDTAEKLHGKLLEDLNKALREKTVSDKSLEKLTIEHADLVHEAEDMTALLKEERDAHYQAATENVLLTKQLTERNNEVLQLKATIEQIICKCKSDKAELNEQISNFTEKLKRVKRAGRIIVKA